MKTARLLVILLAAGFLFLAVGCSEQKSSMQEETPKATSEDVKKEAKELVETTKSYTLEQKQAYEEQLAKKLDEYNQKISALKVQMAQAESTVQTDMQALLESLQTKVEDLQTRANGLKDASGAAWDDMKKGLDQAEEELDQAFSEAMAKFQQSSSKY